MTLESLTLPAGIIVLAWMTWTVWCEFRAAGRRRKLRDRWLRESRGRTRFMIRVSAERRERMGLK